MTNGNIPIGDVLIGGSERIRQGLDLDMQRGANESDATQGEYEDLFEDIANTLVLENTFLGSILDSERYFFVPPYQRYYSWDTSNHEELWRTIEDAVLDLNDGFGDEDTDFEFETGDGRLNEFYFGTLYIAESGGPNSPGEDEEIYEVIDGQQRLATCFIILNEIRLRLERIIESAEEESRENENLDADYLVGIKYLRDGLLKNVLYKGGHNAGYSEYLRIKLHRHDRDYFRTIFEDRPKSVVEILYSLKEGESPEWMRISNIMEKSGKDPEDIHFDLNDLNISVDDGATIDEILSENRYFATRGSHQKIFRASETYEEFIDELLNEKLGFDEDAYRGRAICLINIALLVLVSLRIVECKFETPMDNSLKIDVFKSLNETGEPLDIKSKVRARIVSRFEVGSPQVEQFENIVETFGDNSDTVEKYLIDYILATEHNVVYKKGTVSGNLLRFFSLRGRPSDEIQPRLVENNDEDRESPTEFIQNLETHAEKYKIIDGGKSIPSDHISDRTLRNECNNILNDLKGDQWKPFVLLMYMELTGGSAVVSERFFRDMLRLVEGIMMRNTFAASAATAIESTFIGACKAYNAQDIPVYDEIEPYSEINEQWMEADEFGAETRKIMQAHIVGYSSWNQISGSNIVRNLHGPAWSNNKQVLKLLSRRHLADRIDRGGGAVVRDQLIDFSDTQLEHVFPKEPRINADDSRAPDTVSAPLSGFVHFFQLNGDGEEDGSDEDDGVGNGQQWPGIRARYEELVETDDDEDFDEEGYERLKAQAEPIVEDIGNQILLEEPINNALRNRQFSLKSLGYYLLLKQDLVDFGEYIADLDKIPVNDGELVRLVECLGLKLSEGETKVLLHEAVNAISHITLDRVNRDTEIVDLDDSSFFDPNEFDTHYSTATELFEMFELDQDEYSDLFEGWEDYEYDSTVGGLVADDSDEHRGPDELMDEMVEAVLLRLVGSFDETEVLDSSGPECELSGDYIVHTINSKWNWKIVVDRKVDIVERLLEELKLPTLDSEFSGLDTEYHRESIAREFRYA